MAAEQWAIDIILTLFIIPLIFVGICFICCLSRLCCSSESKSESQLETRTPEVQPTKTPTAPANSSLISRAQTFYHRLGVVVRLVGDFFWNLED